jgi:hypothetical protein
MVRRGLFGWGLVGLATVLMLVVWGRLLVVGATQPSRWETITVTTVDGQSLPGDSFTCRLNAFQRGGIIYRSCDRGDIGTYVLAVDPARRTAVASEPFPATFLPPRWFAAVASDPAGGLTILGDEEGGVVRLHENGRVEPLPEPPVLGIVYGFGWQDGRLGLVGARFDQVGSGPVQVATYEPGVGWSAPVPLPGPPCAAALTCNPLVATPTPDGWATYYARAPRQPSDTARVDAEILLAPAVGATRIMQTVTLTAASRAYRIEEGQLRWSSRLADRTGGNILNYGGYTMLRQHADGRFAALPTPPDDLFTDDGVGAVTRRPELSNLSTSYAITADRLVWQPTYNPGGFSWQTERALLLDDRWVTLQRTATGLYLAEQPLDRTGTYPPGTFTARGPLILGQQEDVLALSDYSSPLLPADGGGYWLLGRSNELIRIGPDLRRLDGHGPLERFGNLFADFGGALDDRFHRELVWPKRLAIGWLLFAWPPLALFAALRGKGARDEGGTTLARLCRAAILFLLLGLASLPWFWAASAYF